MNEDQANYTKLRFKCKKVNFIAPLLSKMHTDRTERILYEYNSKSNCMRCVIPF